ncbi:MAG: general secretion pathway protein C [Rhodoferax sp.]|nr:general secretion pathway protein C [Rhodoferax sp.]
MSSLESIWPARLSAFALSCVAAAGAVYWGLHWRVSPLAVMPPAGTVAGEQPIQTDVVARALGAADDAPAQTASVTENVQQSSRFVLLGVTGNATLGGALIAVDGQAAKAFRVGREVADAWVLRRVEGRRSVLVRQGETIELTLPPPPTVLSVSSDVPNSAAQVVPDDD